MCGKRQRREPEIGNREPGWNTDYDDNGMRKRAFGGEPMATAKELRIADCELRIERRKAPARRV
jgi:hypothetical protein